MKLRGFPLEGIGTVNDTIALSISNKGSTNEHDIHFKKSGGTSRFLVTGFGFVLNSSVVIS